LAVALLAILPAGQALRLRSLRQCAGLHRRLPAVLGVLR
jgi:hypothetical protein